MKDLLELRSIIDREMDSLNYPNSPELLYRPIKYITQLKSKRIRPLLVLIAYHDHNLLVEENVFPPQHNLLEVLLVHEFHKYDLYLFASARCYKPGF